MKKLLYISLFTIMFLATGCVSQHNVNSSYNQMKPDYIRLDVTMDDYQYLGDVTMEVVYKNYGLWKKIVTINGESYNPRYYTLTAINFPKSISMSSIMRKACYKIVETYPNADYVVPASSRVEYEHMFAARNVKETLTVKVFALKVAQ